QLKNRELISEIELKDNKKYYSINQPIIFSNSPYKRNSFPPPESGEHTTEVLFSLGYSEEDVESFLLEKVIF
ncbi:MAG: formyl-CoA transferase, partial [Candidatus Heimdallarchaeota archaeon]